MGWSGGQLPLLVPLQMAFGVVDFLQSLRGNGPRIECVDECEAPAAIWNSGITIGLKEATHVHVDCPDKIGPPAPETGLSGRLSEVWKTSNRYAQNFVHHE
jgi:hypothetical protein